MDKRTTNLFANVKQRLLAGPGKFLDNLPLARKLMLLYLCCVLLPLILTDSVIIYMTVRAEHNTSRHEMENIADAIKYSLSNRMDNAANLSLNIYSNKYINAFLEADYQSPLDYFERYQDFLKDSLYEASVVTSNYQIVMYTDNPGIVNGGSFWNLDTIKGEQWYRDFIDSGQEILAYPYYESSVTSSQRKISIIRRMDYYHKGSGPNLVKMDLDYSSMSQSIVNAKYSFLVYICDGDTILFSNDGHGGMGKPYETFTSDLLKKTGISKNMNVYGRVWNIYVLNRELSALALIKNNFHLLIFLLCLNLLLPALLMTGLNHSFTSRLMELGAAFEKGGIDELKALPAVRGKDEIGILMESYNLMAGRINDLIQTVYKDRLKEQEMDIARQKAELLALHSQINPHFLFNALESIRMHSLLKKELETAGMVERLALMERQYVDWGTDSISIHEEIQFVEAYLELQKYRFGNRLSYQIEVDDSCRGYCVPKLTLVTFAENACVHGLENKTAAGWIFVRCYCDEGVLCMEVEDTGHGMSPDLVRDMQENMNNASMQLLKGNRRVGIMNACLRLRMATGNQACFELESEKGSGTIITIKIPVEALHKKAWKQNENL
ncbi:two-component system, sensor histidine kinase YesM [Lachnospiraceae bacterium NLAE-zl-G231]|nr:two-component system, sensor histidine kinase YesM [Lachnospiraceae bacterium NLAE-zl-G231]